MDYEVGTVSEPSVHSSIFITHWYKGMKQRAVERTTKNHEGERITLSCIEQSNELWWKSRPIQGDLKEDKGILTLTLVSLLCLMS